MLLRKGYLYRSVINSSPRVEGNSVTIGSNLTYARIHNDGGTITQPPRSNLYNQNRYKSGAKKGMFKKGTIFGKGSTFGGRTIKIPARQFMKLTPTGNLSDIKKSIVDYIRKG